MEELLRRMLPVGAPIPDEEHLDYSFAVEYHGPPVAYELPKAVPIDVDSIPTAASLSVSSVPDRSLVPVVQPVLVPVRYPDLKFGRKPSGIGEYLTDVCLVSDSFGSPKSVIVDESAVDLIERVPCTIPLEESESDSRKKSVELSETGTSSNHGELESAGYGETIGVIEHGLGTRNYCSEPQEDPSPETAFFQSDRSGEDMNPPDWISTESALSSPFLSSDASSCKAGDQAPACPPCDVKRASVVTFCVDESDAESSSVVETDTGPVEDPFVNHNGLLVSSSGEHFRDPETWVKKGSCHRCLKGNRFTDKEACIVCDAKYCSNCVLRAMGSMPEGRKCIGCIGYPIEESKRESLGKCSRMLKRLLSPLEIQQVKVAEKSCEANQIQPAHVYVNKKPLCLEEMTLLQGCPNPPIKLKPGSYWYDKVSGLWGKEGHKPDKIISPNLNVGGNLMHDASFGNAGVFINGREITKKELRMLQWAGVQCAGNPHFWVNADGSYQEEGQKNIKGKIWEKPGTKLVCSILSLPSPKGGSSSEMEVNNQPNGTMPDYLEQRTLQKLLLVGCHGSGTGTIFKQAKFLYKPIPFSEDELQSIKLMIQTNVYSYLGVLLEGRERFEEENLMELRKDRLLDGSAAAGDSGGGDVRSIYSIIPRLKAFSDWLLKVMVAGDLEAIFPAATREYAPIVEELWKDPAIQATYSRRSELQMLPSAASYFLERVVDISRVDYEPSKTDILYAEGITSSNGLASMEFSFPKSTYDASVDVADQHDPFLRYQLVRVRAKGLNGNCKWLEMFEDVPIILFCVALSDYDELCDDGSGTCTNKMMVAKALFESLVSHPSFDQTSFFLILNKFDLLEEKISQTPLTVCEWFDSFNPVITSHRSSSSINNNSNNNNGVSLAQQAYHYVAVKFKKLYTSLTGRKLYVIQTNGWEWKAVDGALRYAREVLKWEEEKAVLCGNEFSAYSTEVSSFSH